MSKNSLLVNVVGVVVDRVTSTGIPRKTVKPELVHGESEISDHLKDLQKNLMRQVHEDVINKPNMLANYKMESCNSCGDSKDLDFGIAELMKVILLLYYNRKVFFILLIFIIFTLEKRFIRRMQRKYHAADRT